MRRSKTDQQGAGTWIAAAAAIHTGPVFRPLRAGRVLEQRLPDRAVARARAGARR